MVLVHEFLHLSPVAIAQSLTGVACRPAERVEVYLPRAFVVVLVTVEHCHVGVLVVVGDVDNPVHRPLTFHEILDFLLTDVVVSFHYF